MENTSKHGESFDCILIGAGMAGASLAAALAGRLRVLLLEAEPQAGYHSTGRSAALYAPIYGNALIRALTRASRPFFDAPPAAMGDTPLLCPRDTLFLVGAGQQDLADAFRAEPDVGGATQVLSVEQTLARVPVLARERIAGALLDSTSADIEVDLLHQGICAWRARWVHRSASASACWRWNGWVRDGWRAPPRAVTARRVSSTPPAPGPTPSPSWPASPRCRCSRCVAPPP